MLDPVTPQTTLGTLLRTHRAAQGLTQKALAQACGLSPVYISQLEKGERTPSVQACRALAAALACPVEPLALLVYQATVPQALQALVQPGSVAVDADPVLHEFLPLLASVRCLAPATRGQLLQLWQAMVDLAEGAATPPSDAPSTPTYTEAYATLPVH
jgi:transcriptional regulator with XRE-family HTH domain